MGQAKPASFRLQLIRERQTEKLSYRALADRHGISYNTARNICVSFAQRGEAALAPDYSRCGRPVSWEAERNYRLVRLVKYLHPSWGVPFITCRIQVAYPEVVLCSNRHYQRRLKSERISQGLELPATILPKAKANPDVRQAHDEWQVDAKEQIQLQDGSRICYLNITDTKTNALLAAKVFPPQPD